MQRTVVEVVQTDGGTYAARIQVFESDSPGEFVEQYTPNETFDSRQKALEWAASVDLDH